MGCSEVGIPTQRLMKFCDGLNYFAFLGECNSQVVVCGGKLCDKRRSLAMLCNGSLRIGILSKNVPEVAAHLLQVRLQSESLAVFVPRTI